MKRILTAIAIVFGLLLSAAVGFSGEESKPAWFYGCEQCEFRLAFNPSIGEYRIEPRRFEYWQVPNDCCRWMPTKHQSAAYRNCLCDEFQTRLEAAEEMTRLQGKCDAEYGSCRERWLRENDWHPVGGE